MVCLLNNENTLFFFSDCRLFCFSIQGGKKERKMERLPDLCDRFPQFVDALLRDPVSEKQVLDYMVDIDIRRDIFHEFQRLARDPTTLAPPLNAIALGIIMVAPVDELRSQLKQIETALNPTPSANGILSLLCGQAVISGIRTCGSSRNRVVLVRGGTNVSVDSSLPHRRSRRPPNVSGGDAEEARSLKEPFTRKDAKAAAAG